MEVENTVEFNIYGPLEDSDYWEKCKSLMAKLPDHITCNYKGPVSPQDVPHVFSQHHLFLFPSGGENYGHVIAESLLAGTPVIISDQTPWKQLEEKRIGWDLELNSPIFIETIHNFARYRVHKDFYNRNYIIRSTLKYLADHNDVEQNRMLFLN